MKTAAKVESSLSFIALAAMLAAAWIIFAAAPALADCSLTGLHAIAQSATTIVNAQLIAATSTLPEYCEVQGYVSASAPANQDNFELGIPDPELWNNRLLFIGNGGYAGTIPDITSGVALGYATVGTDTGHQSADGAAAELDGSWALNNLAGQEDFGFRAVHLVADAAASLVDSYYGSAPTHRYFYGCSDGGREAMVEAQVFPTDFDGIIAGDPAIGNTIAGFNWNDEALLDSADSWIPSAKLQLIDDAVLSECDGRDGVKDGLIQDPRKCHFNPRTLQCKSGDSDPNNDPSCLSIGQIAALRQIWAGARIKKQQIYPGYMQSDPAGTDGWGLWIIGFNSPAFNPPSPYEPWGDPPLRLIVAPYQWDFMDEFLKYFVFANPDYNSLSFAINNMTDLKTLETALSIGGSMGTNADLTAFQRTGGKLIMYHGWSDPAISPLASIAYYLAAQRVVHGQKTLRGFARLFMVPGMHHCSGGPGPNVFDPLAPLDAWVSDGTAPDGIIAEHLNSQSQVDRTMPLCAYPERAVYNHKGDVDSASSWTCKGADA